MKSVTFKLLKNGVALLEFNTPERAENKLTGEDILKLEEYILKTERQLDILESDDEIKAVVLCSAKRNSFLSGIADSEYLKFANSDDGRAFSLKFQELCEKMENSRAPFIAALGGNCLSTGLEIALCCSYRVASSGAQMSLGFTDIDNGLIPCAGGMYRLQKLIGTNGTLDMVLTGRLMDLRSALELGLVDEIVPDEILLDIAIGRALQHTRMEIKTHKSSLRAVGESLINENLLARKMMFSNARRKIKSQNLNITAPMMAIEVLELGSSNFESGHHVESVYFGELAVSNTTKQLIRTNFAIDEVEHKHSKTKSLTTLSGGVGKIFLVGETEKTSRIAYSCADIGVGVRIKADDNLAAGKGMKTCYEFFTAKFENNEIDDLQLEKKLDLISATSDYTGIKRANIIIETCKEDVKTKKEIFSELLQLLDEKSIYISGSYVIPSTVLSNQSGLTDRVVGYRLIPSFYNSSLLEIGVSDSTSEATLDTVVGFARALGKVPLIVKDVPGFYTARVQLAYFNEACYLLDEGCTVDQIDEAMRDFGFEGGPLEQIDELGIDLVSASMNILYGHYGERMKPHPSLELMAQDGRLGVKSAKGFYKYRRGERSADKAPKKYFTGGKTNKLYNFEKIQEWLVLAFINEALVCLDDGVIENVQEGDVGAILGLGFPAYRGGPFRYADSIGAGNLLKKLHNLTNNGSVRNTPAQILKNTAVAEGKLYE